MASEVSRRSVPPAFASVSTGSIVIASESPLSGGVRVALTDVLFRARVLEVFFLEPLAVGFTDVFADVFALAAAVFGFADFFTFSIVVFSTRSLFVFALTFFAVVVFPGRTVLPAEEAVRLFFARPVADAARLEPQSSTAVADLLFFAETRLAVGFLLTFRARDDFGF